MNGNSGDDEDTYRGNGYDGTRVPVNIADVRCTPEPAVVFGELRYDGMIIRAEGIGFLVVEDAGELPER